MKYHQRRPEIRQRRFTQQMPLPSRLKPNFSPGLSIIFLNRFCRASLHRLIKYRFFLLVIVVSAVSIFRETEKLRHVAGIVPTSGLPSCVVLTSFFTGQLDPQRKKQVPSDISYMKNFMLSLSAVGLRAVVFHDNLDSTIARSLTKQIELVQVPLKDDSTINDYRFFAMFEWLQGKNFDFVLLADISDVVFFGNPLSYMKSRSSGGFRLFLSDDFGVFYTNLYHNRIAHSCFPLRSWKGTEKVYSAGLWGGERRAVERVLSCLKYELSLVTHGKGNCNMAAFNKCVHDLRHMYKVDDHVWENGLFNRFTVPSDCNGDHLVVHDKCIEWARYTDTSLEKVNRCVQTTSGRVKLVKCR